MRYIYIYTVYVYIYIYTNMCIHVSTFHPWYHAGEQTNMSFNTFNATRFAQVTRRRPAAADQDSARGESRRPKGADWSQRRSRTCVLGQFSRRFPDPNKNLAENPPKNISVIDVPWKMLLPPGWVYPIMRFLEKKKWLDAEDFRWNIPISPGWCAMGCSHQEMFMSGWVNGLVQRLKPIQSIPLGAKYREQTYPYYCL